MIYLDNAATTFPKPIGMIEEMARCMVYYCGNPGRSGHDLSIKTGEEVYRARKEIAELFHIQDCSHVIFTLNATDSLNMAIKGTLREGDHVITTAMEHNSVLRPLKALEKKGVQTTIVPCTRDGYVRPDFIEKEIRKNTKMIACTHASNVTGSIQPIEEIGRIATAHQLLFLVDASQSAGCVPIDVMEMHIDLLAMPGHKGLLGPLGTGILYIRPGLEVTCVREGGTGTNSRDLRQPLDFPEGYESGTVNAPGIIGLGRSVRFLKKMGIEAIRHHEERLIGRLEEAVYNINDMVLTKGKIKMYGPQMGSKLMVGQTRGVGQIACTNRRKTGILCFNVEGMDCEEVTQRLNEYGIASRAGFHCAGLAHRTIGTVETGAVRLSVGPFNTIREMDVTARALFQIARNA